ncbi:hypothetical protein Adt_21600 [Abeliophyllum distichum]|uniref:Uncharacterized protein n=1 Tax=Abeliophyllum distichum TaxID=126358 RepID=A0ABD1SZV6_9LAMI
MLQSYFDFQGDQSPDEYRSVCTAINRMVADRYQDYKLKAHNHLKAHELSHLYGELSSENLQKRIDFFTSPTFVLRETQQMQVVSNGVSVDKCAIAKEVLGD